MADRNVESDELGVPQIDETLEILLLQAIEEAQERMEAGSEVGAVHGTAQRRNRDRRYPHRHDRGMLRVPAREDRFEAATRRSRRRAWCSSTATIDTDAGRKDAIIAEGGTADGGKGVAARLDVRRGR